MSPLVSVCILSFNHEKYIRKAIDSVLAQSYSNIEIIIVDNGSSDSTPSLIPSSYREEILSGKIKFFPLPSNTYPSHGTNFGLRQASGKYISILSGDDTFVPHKIERQLDVMAKDGLTNLFTWVNIIDECDNVIENNHLEFVFNRNYKSPDIKAHFLREGNMLCALSLMFERTIFEKHGLFDERLIQLQDYDFWLRIISKEPINLLREKLVNYRERGDGQNLSLLSSNERTNRVEFEELYVNRNFLNFDIVTIESVTERKVDEYGSIALTLYDYYSSLGNENFAKGFLLSIYDEIGPRVSFPSHLYNRFFECYSTVSFFNSELARNREREISLLKEKLHLYESSRVIGLVKLMVSWYRKFFGKHKNEC